VEEGEDFVEVVGGGESAGDEDECCVLGRHFCGMWVGVGGDKEVWEEGWTSLRAVCVTI
jgi:hypothetical protein